jgi:hypothetical protein
MTQETYTTERFHPITGEKVECRVFLNYYGIGKDGFKFKGDQVFYSSDELEALLPSQGG